MWDGWMWVERLSWVVTILGIPGLILALWRRPKLKVGFPPAREVGRFRKRRILAKDHTVDVPDATGGKAIDLSFAIVNDGRGSARDLVVNFVFPAEIRLEHLTVPGTRPPDEYSVRPEDNRVIWAFQVAYIHPGDRQNCFTGIRFPPGINRLAIRAEVSMADSGTLRRTLVVNVRRVT